MHPTFFLRRFPPLETVPKLDISRFMGKWYVLANISTFLDDESYNAIEEYTLNDDDNVAVDFSFNDESLDGPLKEYELTGFIDPEVNSKWQMQPFWPLKADFRIVYLDESYEQTIIARPNRDYVWIMARTPVIAKEDFNRMVEYVGSIGYDVNKISPTPHDQGMNLTSRTAHSD